MSRDTSGVPLPVELLHAICQAADSSEFYSIALSSRTLNEIVTPTLYSNIDLHHFNSIYACVRTLAFPPRTTAMNRDLASFVQTLSLQDPDAWAGMSAFPPRCLPVLGRRLASALPRMRRLRSITCQIGIPHTLQIFTTLASGALQYVDAIDINLRYPYLPEALRRGNPDDAPVAVGARGLKTLKMDWSGTPPSTYMSAMCSLLTANYSTLQSLAIPHHAGVLKSVWRSTLSLPVLEELEISPEILSEPAFQDTSSIRRFSVPGWYTWDGIELPATTLPNLQDVTCFPGQLQAFLPEHAEHRRPISSVTLNHVRYGRTRTGGHHAVEHRGIVHLWNLDIGPALSALQYSGSPLRRLGFAVGMLSVDALLDLAPHLKDLEYLLIVLNNPRMELHNVDGLLSLAQVLSYMPRLNTLLLSDGLLKTSYDGPFEFAYDEDSQCLALAAYDQQSSTLRRIAFTTEFEWEKREDGWRPWGYVVHRQEIVSDGEDEDEGHGGM